jgi:hypothetical protein
LLDLRFLLGRGDDAFEVSSAVVAIVTVLRVRFEERGVTVDFGLTSSLAEVVDAYWNFDSWPLNDGVGGSGVMGSVLEA